MKSLLVLRLSSMGDVILTKPVMLGVLDKNPDIRIVFVTRKKFIPYFKGNDRLLTVSFDPEGVHRGMTGLVRLFRELKSFNCDYVIDLHGIIRTRILDTLFLITGKKVYRIRKYRKLRREILKKRTPGLTVPHAVDRYLEVFEKAGFKGALADCPFRINAGHPGLIPENPSVIRIGLAPLSKHRTKNWGLQHVSELIRLLRLQDSIELHLFGGIEDQEELNALTGPGVINHAGNTDALDEISLFRKMDLFLSMDSANMHLASLTGIPTLSVWGATDPTLGFGALNQPRDYSLWSDSPEVYCRPCSVYGEIPCRRTDAPMICMNSITPLRVLDKIKEILRLSGKTY
ncbi:MAG: glycosyltransferase family 9 protein [Bacteroidales bacterium]|jgi:ADP-heptose:LPS heptosyltransferase